MNEFGALQALSDIGQGFWTKEIAISLLQQSIQVRDNNPEAVQFIINSINWEELLELTYRRIEVFGTTYYYETPEEEFRYASS
jgi:hypothetical protein